MSRLLRRGLVLAAVLAAAALICDDAFGRVGGGQSFSSGGSSSGGGGYSGGGGEIDIIFLLIRVCIEYPAIGIPLLILFLIFVIARVWWGKTGRKTRRFRSKSTASRPNRRRRPTGLDALKKEDDGWSEPVFVDFVQMIHRRAYEAVNGTWDPLAPFADPSIRDQLKKTYPGVTSFSEVVTAGVTIQSVEKRGAYRMITVEFKSSRLEHKGEESSRAYVEESWTFRRGADARSLPPEDVQRLGCPSCGAAIETDKMGACTNCGTPITKGQLQWQAIAAKKRLHRRVKAPEVGFTNGGEEPGHTAPTVVDPDFGAQARRFQGRHPDFDVPRFQERAKSIFLQLQDAWSEGRWELARPHTTDPMYQSLRFWLDRYARNQLKNRLADVRVNKMQLVKMEMDAWYESITVRIWAQAKDWIEAADGTLVGGNKRQDRYFSEYWTFIRAVGSGDEVKDAHACPSCGAPLDKISQTGVCGYCGSKITTGQFDWVLSRIDQAEVYGG